MPEKFEAQTVLQMLFLHRRSLENNFNQAIDFSKQIHFINGRA
jgi:hypothetical protein